MHPNSEKIRDFTVVNSFTSDIADYTSSSDDNTTIVPEILTCIDSLEMEQKATNKFFEHRSDAHLKEVEELRTIDTGGTTTTVLAFMKSAKSGGNKKDGWYLSLQATIGDDGDGDNDIIMTVDELKVIEGGKF
ncbi:hypothetical protein RUND412_009996 [Rhizina undulata]